MLIRKPSKMLIILALGSMFLAWQPSAADASDANPNATTASAPDGAVGHEIQLLVKARDAVGNFLTHGGNTVTATISGTNNTTLSFVDNGDGTYVATYIPSAVGTDSVSIFVNGTELATSPFSSQVYNGFQLKVMTLNVKRSDLYEWDQWVITHPPLAPSSGS